MLGRVIYVSFSSFCLVNFLSGYKQRKHLAKALKTRCKSIKAAVEEYNAVAKKMDPPRETLTYEAAVNYTFLSEFDLLRDSRDDVRSKPWADPSNRVLLNQFFKLVGATDELDRLHQEIQRLVTFMKVEREQLTQKELELRADQPALALQVRSFRWERGRFSALHRKRLLSIIKLKGFDLAANEKFFHAGTPVEQCRDVDRMDVSVDLEPEAEVEKEGSEQEDDDDWEDEEEELEQVDAVLSVVAEASL